MSDRHYVHHEDEVQLAKLLKESKPFLEKYGTTIIYAVAAVMAVAAVVVYVQRRPAPTAEASSELLLATTAEDYRDVADAFPDSPIGILSRLRQADRELEDAVSSMFTNREAAIEGLATAEKAYQQLENRKDIQDSVRERVLVGLARVAECRCDGSDEKVKSAIAAWERVLTSFPDSKTFRSAAEARIKRLGTMAAKEFYAWFHQQNPKPGDDLLMPQDGGPGQVPGIPNFPTLQSLGLPAGHPPVSAGDKPVIVPTGTETSPTKGESPVDDKPETTPEAKPETPAAEAPKADPPAADTPAQESTPADKPATETPASDTPAAEAPVPEKSGE